MTPLVASALGGASGDVGTLDGSAEGGWAGEADRLIDGPLKAVGRAGSEAYGSELCALGGASALGGTGGGI